MRGLLLTLLLLAPPALAQDGLDRLTTREDLRGFEPVGRVDLAEGGFCTGALIAPDLVLTAGHCVLRDDGTPVPAETITFRAGLAEGVALAESAVLRTVVDPGFTARDPAPAAELELDVALLELASPIPTGLISPFSVALPGTGDEVSVVSYAAGRETALSWQPLCHALDRQGALIVFDCVVDHGSSGAPVLDRSHYRAKIVSIISSGGVMQGRRVAIGMELPARVAALKAELRAGRATSVAAPAPERKAGKRILPGSGKDGTGARFVTP